MDPNAVEIMRGKAAIALCILEKKILASFLDIKSHLVEEVEICDP